MSVKAIKYRMKVFTDWIHGMTVEFNEVFIPSTGVVFNYVENNLHVFHAKKARYLKEMAKSTCLDEHENLNAKLKIDHNPVEIMLEEELVKQLVPRSDTLIEEVKKIVK